MKLDYSEPKIYTGGVDISKWSKLTKAQQNAALEKSWFVYYSYRNPKTGRLKRQPHIKAGANRLKTKRDRYKVLQLLRDELSVLLHNGFNPYTYDEKHEQDILEEQTQGPGKIEIPVFTSDNQEEFQTSKDDQEEITPQPPTPTPEKSKPLPADEDQTSISEAFEFALAMKKNMMTHNSFLKYRSRIRQFKTWIEEHYNKEEPITKVTKKSINLYLNSVLLRSSARNRNNTRTDIASFYQLLEDNEIVEKNIVKSIPKLKSKPTRNKTYTPEQEEKINKYLKKNNPNLLLYIKFISYNFLRPVEVSRLQIKDVDLKNKRIYVRAKNQPVKIKIIPDILLKEIPDFTHAETDAFLFGRFNIGEYWDAKDSNRSGEYSKRFKKVKDHFSLGKDYGLYSFRHTFITKLYRKFREKLSPFEAKSKLMLITGHSTMAALEKYLRDIDAELPEDYSDLFE